MATPAAGIWRPLVVCAHPRLGTTIGVALSELGIPAAHMVPHYPAPGKAAEIQAQHQCNICFIDVASDQARGLALIGEMAAGCAVVAINEGKEADLILRCLRRGACEFLPDAGADTLAGLFRRLSPGSTIAAQHRRGKLYTVIPGKPGCGASTLAAHLAVELHIDPQHGVLLVDTDSLTGSISFMLKLKAEFHLDDLLRDWRRLDQDLWARLPARSAGIDVLLAPESPSIRTEIGRGLAGEISSYWRERYDAVVVDCGDVRSAVESGFASAADAVLLVTTNELAALHATKRSLEYLE
jgi:pilus assembly protein CpaE